MIQPSTSASPSALPTLNPARSARPENLSTPQINAPYEQRLESPGRDNSLPALLVSLIMVSLNEIKMYGQGIYSAGSPRRPLLLSTANNSPALAIADTHGYDTTLAFLHASEIALGRRRRAGGHLAQGRRGWRRLLEGADWVVGLLLHEHQRQNRPTRIQIADISSTIHDPLHAVRTRLRPLHGVASGIPVVYTTEVRATCGCRRCWRRSSRRAGRLRRLLCPDIVRARRILVDEDDVALLFEDVDRGRSVVDGRGGCGGA
ncbi:ThiF domain-containing protein [Mycena venus]|uniref:ThiF domain-containing protein n=1 Tax=Mycena venus TaxID=2733690 RepID=A0A8H7CPM7_9AGAR|nr:ThiF domain-containing protein [Mycena venus]